MIIKRPLTTLNYPFFFLSRVVNANSCEYIELEGYVNKAQLTEAITKALKIHPLLNCTLRRKIISYEWFEDTSRELPISIEFHDCSDFQQSKLNDQLLNNVWERAIDHFTERAVRFHVTKIVNGTIIQIVSSHLTSDAKSGFRLVFDIANCYSGINVRSSTNTDLIDVANRNSDKLFISNIPKKTRFFYAIKALSSICLDIIRPDIGLDSRKVARGKTKILKTELGKELLLDLKQYSRNRNLTLHSLFSLAMLRVREQYNHNFGVSEKIFRLLDLFSLRKFSNNNVDHLYDVMVIPFNTRLSPKWSDEKVLNYMVDHLKNLNSGAIMIELYRQKIYSIIGRLSPNYKFATNTLCKLVVKGNVILTNPGIIPYEIEYFGQHKVVDFYNYSQLFPPGRVMFIFNTFRDDLRMITLYDENALSSDEVSELLVEPILSYLKMLVKDDSFSYVKKDLKKSVA
ncbi:hypothetical protein MNBD_GAMMA22-52 [hydrothermal vent metagenome]|uniref:Condensation domain-containing protein n=1 Tax=hydrothermal vent metagenome TaxID=652676 RepID=A0A3B1A709_9ZZZZ